MEYRQEISPYTDWSSQVETVIKSLHNYFTEIDFIQNQADHCVYTQHNNNKERIIIISWVNDIILATKNMDSLNNIKRMLTSNFKMKSLEKLRHFQGIDF